MRKIHLPLDEYDLRARLFPAILITLPALAAIWILWPAARSFGGIAAGSVVESAVLFWLTKIARDQGKRIESRLFSGWGGKPTTAVLRWSDFHFDMFTKERYRKTLSTILGLKLPTPEEEAVDPARADQLYDSCIRGLLEKRRGKAHRLIFNENCNYGFVRNLLGLKATGITVSLFSIAAQIWVFVEHRPASLDALMFSIAVAILVLVLLVVFATPEAARRTAMAYADALLRSCEPATSRRRVS